MALKALLNLTTKLNPKLAPERYSIVTIGFSHFCEKARWALDKSPLTYHEDLHTPALHLTRTLELRKLPRIKGWHDIFEQHSLVRGPEADEEVKARKEEVKARKEVTGVPKMVIPSHQPLNANDTPAVLAHGSVGVLLYLHTRFPEMHLYGKEEDQQAIMDLEHYFIEHLAPNVTDFSFGHLILSGMECLAERVVSNNTEEFYRPCPVNASTNKGTIDFFLDKCCNSKRNGFTVPWFEKLVLKVAGKRFLIPLMIKNNGINAGKRDVALWEIEGVLMKVDKLLIARMNEDQRQHLLHNVRGKEKENSEHKTSISSFPFLFDCVDQSQVSSEPVIRTPSAADISFAAFMMPILMPDHMGDLFCSLNDMREAIDKGKEGKGNMDMSGCEVMVSTAERLLNLHVSARYALWLYENYR